jgi:hypothetical protein
MLFINPNVKPAFIYTAETPTTNPQTFICYEITPESFFIQTTELTGTLVYLGTYEDEEIWEPGVEVIETEYLSPEALLMKMSFHFEDSSKVTIDNRYTFSDSGNFRNFKTGLTIRNQPVFVTQNQTDGICFPYIGTAFVQHQQIQAKFDIAPF